MRWPWELSIEPFSCATRLLLRVAVMRIMAAQFLVAMRQIGHQAARLERSVLFTHVPCLLEELALARLDGCFPRLSSTSSPASNCSFSTTSEPTASPTSSARSQLFGWRRKAIKSGAVTPQRDAARLGFVEVTPTASVSVEIELGGVVIRAGADINEEQLVRIIRAVRQA